MFLKFDYVVNPREELIEKLHRWPALGRALMRASVKVVLAGRGLLVFPQFLRKQPWESRRGGRERGGGMHESDATLTTPWRWKSMSAKQSEMLGSSRYMTDEALGGIFWGVWRLKWRCGRLYVLLSGRAGWEPLWRTPDLTFLTAFHYWLTRFWLAWDLSHSETGGGRMRAEVQDDCTAD